MIGVLKHSDDYDITSAIELILVNLPNDISIMESIRLIYVRLGRLFSYDYNVASDINIALRKVDFENVSNYQTCTQISEILKACLSYINKNVKCEVINRNVNVRGVRGDSHRALAVSFEEDGYQYNLLLDLTLDLFRIQSGMQTKQFAYTTDAAGKYDIIPLRECELMDRKLGLTLGYLDEEINIVKDILDSSKASLEDKITYIVARFSKRFMGAHEALMYYKELFLSLIDVPFKEFNLTKEEGENVDMISLFKFDLEDRELYFLLDKNNGLELTNPLRIRRLLSCGYTIKSVTLMAVFDDDAGRKVLS